MMMHNKKFRAFTLIELLVVISIIALLVGILLPALGAARRSAQGLICQTNMKNLTTAFVAYGTDHNGWWPARAAGYDSDPENLYLGAWVPAAGLVSASGTKPYPRDIADGDLWDYTPDYGVFECPSDPLAHFSCGLSYSISNHLYREVRTGNFAAATSMEPSYKVTTASGRTAIYPQSDKIRQPSNFIYILDEGGPEEGQANSGLNDGYFENLRSDQPGGNPSPSGADATKWYHSDGSAFGFGDGHGEIRKKTDKEIYSYSYNFKVADTPRYFSYGRIWDPVGQAPIIAGQP